MSDLENALHPTHFAGTGVSEHRPEKIALLGAGECHLQLLQHLALHPTPGVRITLITSLNEQVIEACLPEFVAGRFALEDIHVPLEPLVRKAGVRWLQRSVKALDAATRNLLLDDGSTEYYDLLSVDTGPLHNRLLSDAQLPGSKKHALFLLPSRSFVALWPQVLKMGQARGLRIAVIGQDARAVSTAFAVRGALPASSITLVAGPLTVGYYAPQPLRGRIAKMLKKQRITVLQDTATTLDGTAVMLGCGAALACDVPIYAGAPQAPTWIQSSGLQTDSSGLIDLDDFGRCVNFNEVWVPAHAPGLKANLMAVLSGRPLQTTANPTSARFLQPSGDRCALGQWGPLSAGGRWIWWLYRSLTLRNRNIYR
jgi:selenide,water dikinase